jgi:hypothetical protein
MATEMSEFIKAPFTLKRCKKLASILRTIAFWGQLAGYLVKKAS